LECVPSLFRGFVTSGIKKGMPRERYTQAMKITKDEKLWKERMAVSNDDVAYLMLLDRSGKLIWMQSSGFNNENYLHLKEQIQNAMK
jgi:hypothetical protein